MEIENGNRGTRGKFTHEFTSSQHKPIKIPVNMCRICLFFNPEEISRLQQIVAVMVSLQTKKNMLSYL